MTNIINFGPQHPATHGVLRLVLELDGELIVKADPHIGFLHRGTEKLIEQKTYMQALPYFDRLDYVSPMACEHCFAMATEKLLNIEIPIRASYIRVIFSELTRIMNHLLNITTMALDVGAMTPLLWGFEDREKILEFCEEVCGARLHTAYIRPGGVAKDLSDELLLKIENFLEELPSHIKDLEHLLTDSYIFMQRTVGIGIVSKEQAIEWGFSGPPLRASGVEWDLRRTQSYEVYNMLDFDIPVGINGDCYERYLVRIHEIYESIKILKQAIRYMPKGDYVLQNHKITPPHKKDVKEKMESLIHHFKLFSEGYSVQEGETYTAIEAPKGEFGVYLISDGSNKPYRCKIRAPGFAFLQSVEFLQNKMMISDLVAIIGSLDIVFGEIDR